MRSERGPSGPAIPVEAEGRPVARFLRIAAVVAVVDLATKLAAVAAFAPGADRLGRGIHFATVYNDRLADSLGGWGHPRAVTALATAAILACMLRVLRDVAAIDRGAPTMFGLVAGAAVSNLVSQLVVAGGVPDFIDVRWDSAGDGIVLNAADVALAVGLVLCCRTVYRLAIAIGRERGKRLPLESAREVTTRSVVRARAVGQRPTMLRDVEVPLFAAPMLADVRAERAVHDTIWRDVAPAEQESHREV